MQMVRACATCFLALASTIAIADQSAQPAAAPVRQGGTPEATPLTTRRTGDFDELVKRRTVRILTPYSRTQYFIDKGVQRGIVFDAGMLLEQYLNATLKTTPATKVHVVFVPTSRDALYKSLVDGVGDIVAAGITVTPEREQLVDFTVPVLTSVNQVVVSGPGAPAVTTVDGLAGTQVAVRTGSIQFESLTALNVRLKSAGKTPVTIKALPPSLEDEDILEMVSSGLVRATVVDRPVADFWKQVLPELVVHEQVVVREGGAFAWAVRKGSPKLVAALNPFLKANRAGTLHGNELLRRYLKDTRFVKNATSDAELRKFRAVVDLFRKYAGQYDLDYILMIAQGYQESQLDQDAKSGVGAIGIMQVMPATAKELQVGDVRQMDPNVHAGVKYIRYLIDRHFAQEPAIDRLNRMLFAFAAYNCGPGRMKELRAIAKKRGLDSNVWFNNVERIASERVGRETVQYVSNIYKYYVAYSLTMDEWAKPGGRT
jgi:membrane-bound lytic murein transglycosylase MltF